MIVRIAYVCADAGVPVFGTKGCSVHVQEIIKEFLRRGDSVALYALRFGGDNSLVSSRFEAYEFPIRGTHTTADRELLQSSAVSQIAIELVAGKFDLVYERYSLWSSKPLALARQLGIPSVLEVNAPLIEEQAQHRELIHRKEAEAIRNTVFLAATSIIAVSEGVANYVRSHLPEHEHAKVHVVANGVDTDRFRPDVSPISPNNVCTIGFVGTLKPWHGVESLLSAFAVAQRQIPELILRIIGDGPLRSELEQQAVREQPSLAGSIQWIGAVPPSDVPGHLSAIDVAVAPYLESTDFYFSPLKIYEYMAAGRAVVASSIGQLESVIHHGENGLLYAPGNVQQLSSLLCNLARHPEIVKNLGERARSTAIESHSWTNALQGILNHLRSDCSHADSVLLPAVNSSSRIISGVGSQS